MSIPLELSDLVPLELALPLTAMVQPLLLRVCRDARSRSQQRPRALPAGAPSLLVSLVPPWKPFANEVILTLNRTYRGLQSEKYRGTRVEMLERKH